METAFTVVIKVNFGDMMRRFSVQIFDEKLNLSMDGLRKKIISLFNFAPDTELVLTYIDEEYDVVTLVDSDDLLDVVKQRLNPLRITVKLSSEKHARQFKRSSGVQKPVQNLNTGISEILKTIPEPLRDTLVKFSTELTSNASSSSPGIAELVDCISKVGLSCLGQLSESETRGHSSTTRVVPEDSPARTETKDSDLFEVNATKVPSNGREERYSKCSEGPAKLQPEPTKENNKVTLGKVIGSASSGADSTKVKVGNREKGKKISKCYLNEESNLISSCSPTFVNQNLCSEKKLAELSCRSLNLPSFGNNFPTEEVNEPCEPHLRPDTTCLDELLRDALSCRSDISPPNSIWAPEPLFFGIPYGKISALQSGPASQAVPLRSSSSQDRCDRCNSCGFYPITGPRFKSKVKAGYVLCKICFSAMGNDTDYIRVDSPEIHENHASFLKKQAPEQPNVRRRVSKNRSRGFKLDSGFVRDVNVTDGTLIAPLTPFTKIWRMRNNGAFVWHQKTQLVWIDGDRLSNQVSVELQIPPAGLAVDQELDIAVDCISPERPGHYFSYWRMVSPFGQQFGERVWIYIQVDGSAKQTTQCESIGFLDLNLPPDWNFPNNHGLLEGRGASSSIPCAGPSAPSPSTSIASAQHSTLELLGKKANSWTSSSTSSAGLCPIIHKLDARPRPMTISSSQEPSMGKELEDKHLSELDETGWQTVDWDPIFVELEEM